MNEQELLEQEKDLGRRIKSRKIKVALGRIGVTVGSFVSIFAGVALFGAPGLIYGTIFGVGMVVIGSRVVINYNDYKEKLENDEQKFIDNCRKTNQQYQKFETETHLSRQAISHDIDISEEKQIQQCKKTYTYKEQDRSL